MNSNSGRTGPGQANSANIGVDSEKFGNHYKVLGNGTAGGRMIRPNDNIDKN